MTPGGNERSEGMGNPNQRAYRRIQVEASLQFRVPETEALAVGRLHNYCTGGVYFESPLPMSTDCETAIVIPDLLAVSPAHNAWAAYKVRIRWCNGLKAEQGFKFGIGAAFLDQCEPMPTAAIVEQCYSVCDLCDRELKGECTCRLDGNRRLCLPCYKHVEKIPAGPLRESILRFIDRNIT